MPSLFHTKNKKNNQPESPGQYNSIRIVKERTHRNTSFFCWRRGASTNSLVFFNGPNVTRPFFDTLTHLIVVVLDFASLLAGLLRPLRNEVVRPLN